MKSFTPMEYLQIDIANCWGLDKELWETRLQFVRDNEDVLEALQSDADSPILFAKAVAAYRQAQAQIPVGHVMGLDSTASGPQIMAVMAGCRVSAKAVNLINTGKREDLYIHVANNMAQAVGKKVSRKVIKKPVMVYFYGGESGAKAVFSKRNADTFFKTMHRVMPGPAYLMELFKSLWDPSADSYRWTLPDGHTAYVPVLGVEKKGVEIDELNHFRFTYQSTFQAPQAKGLSLPANIVHSVDAYICRQLVRRADRMGFKVAPVHDCFYASPKHMQKVRQIYQDLLCEINDMNLVEDIVSQIKGTKFKFNKKACLKADIKDSEYFLS